MAADTDGESSPDAPTPDPSLVEAVADAVPSASSDQAAAIAVAISAHMTDRQRAAAAAAAGDAEPSWDGKKWAFAGRVHGTLKRDLSRVRDDAPTDEWTAAGRADRM